jgi:hypothetical protein
MQPIAAATPPRHNAARADEVVRAGCAAPVPAWHGPRVKDFDGYLFVLPNGAGGHGRYPDRLRSAAELQCYEGWLLGCREGPRPGGRRGRRVVVVTPLGTVGSPVGTLAAALAAAGAREDCTYLLAANDDT